MLHECDLTSPHSKAPVLLCLVAAALLSAGSTATTAQELPSGAGPLPELRRGPNGQIEIARPSAASPPGVNRQGAAPAASAPKAGMPLTSRHDAAHSAPATVPVRPEPVITVVPDTPRVPDTTPLGTTLASFSVKMSDGSPFTGTVRFGPPYYDGRGVFALSGNHIIVNPNGPGLGPNKRTITDHFTLEAIP